MSIEANVVQSDNFFAGERKVLKYTILDALGVAVNVSTWGLRWDLKYSKPGAVLLSKASGGSEITVGGASNNEVSVTINPVDTASIQAGTYYIVLWRTDGGQDSVLAFGTLVLQAA